MQKWEYLMVTQHIGMVHKLFVTYFNPDVDDTHCGIDERSRKHLVNWLGEQGWEMVSVTDTAVGTERETKYFFKRPKP